MNTWKQATDTRPPSRIPVMVYNRRKNAMEVAWYSAGLFRWFNDYGQIINKNGEITKWRYLTADER